MRRQLTITLGFILFLLFIPHAIAIATEGAESVTISVYMDGSYVDFSTSKPFVENDVTMVPFRPVFEKMGMKVEWDAVSQRVTGIKNGLKLVLQVGSSTAEVNGVTQTMTAAPQLVDDRVVVPLRFVGESSGREVVWDNYASEVVIADLEGQFDHLLGKNSNYLNNKDHEGLLSTYGPGMKPYAENVEIGFYFRNFSLSHSKPEISNIEKIDDHTYFVKAMKRVSGESYDNHESTIGYEMIKQAGKWVINYFQLMNIHYYDEGYENGPIYLSKIEQAELANMIIQKIEAFNMGDADLYASFYDPSFLTAESILQTEPFHNNLLYLERMSFITQTDNEVVMEIEIFEEHKEEGFNTFDTRYAILRQSEAGSWHIVDEFYSEIEYLHRMR